MTARPYWTLLAWLAWSVGIATIAVTQASAPGVMGPANYRCQFREKSWHWLANRT